MTVFEVYQITHRDTGRNYIGFTGAGTETRWQQHVRDAGRYQACRYLAHAIKCYGPDAFDVVPVFSSREREAATEAERLLIAEYRSLSHENGFNICPGGEGRTSLYCKSGRHLLSEVRRVKGECHPCWLEREQAKRAARTPEQRERDNQAAKERRARNKLDPEKREAARLYSNKKYHESAQDPEFRRKHNARAKKYADERKADPEFRERRREISRKHEAKKKAARAAE